MDKFASQLKELRDEYNLSQTDLAKALNVSQSMIARWESDECEPTATNIIAIADYFGVTTDYLFGRKDY